MLFKPEHVESEGVVTVEGQAIAYNAVAGTIVVHPRGWDDAARREASPAPGANLGAGGNPEAEASMFYTAYFKKGAPAADRPITFIYGEGADAIDHVAAPRPEPGPKPDRHRRQRRAHAGRALFS